MAQRHRVKISARVDPDVLSGVDTYLGDHPDHDRDTVIDEALRIWLDLANEQDRAMEEQYTEPDDRPEHEVAQWKAIRDASARMLCSRGDR
jgi:hypothetical protein